MPVTDHDTLEIQLREERDGLIAYLQVKIKACDWHAVQDAASDIRELEAKLALLRQL